MKKTPSGRTGDVEQLAGIEEKLEGIKNAIWGVAGTLAGVALAIFLTGGR